jgi:hypothetical protein
MVSGTGAKFFNDFSRARASAQGRANDGQGSRYTRISPAKLEFLLDPQRQIRTAPILL